MRRCDYMLGAICGDFIGSTYEWKNVKTKEFDLLPKQSRITDDSVMTIATLEALLDNSDDFATYYRKWYLKYPRSGYGGGFRKWATDPNAQAYNSWGNGAAMRVSPVAYFYTNITELLWVAERTAKVSHNHLEGIKGAQATAACVYMALNNKDKEFIKNFIKREFYYNLDFTLSEIRDTYEFDVSCQGSVPQAIVAFLESNNYEDAIRNAISIGGDSDTIACITGGIAEAFYKHIPRTIINTVTLSLPKDILDILIRFEEYKKE